MELLKVESINGGKAIYLNPVYIESFLDNNDGTCHVYLNSDSESPYRINMKADELAQILSTLNSPNVWFASRGF